MTSDAWEPIPDPAPHRPPRGSLLPVIGALLVMALVGSLLWWSSRSDDQTSQTPGTTGTPGTDGPPSTLEGAEPRDFNPDIDGHMVAEIDDLATYEALAAVGVTGQGAVKFTIADFLEDDHQVSFYDSNFFVLHDEWYWWQLLNDIVVPGTTTEPVPGLSFDTVADVYEWAQGRNEADLPLDLRWTNDGRLYSPEFYSLALDDINTRSYGVGTIVHIPERTGDTPKPEFWLMELEFSDGAGPDQIARYLDILTGVLPDEIGDNLVWVVRSPDQEEVAVEMAASELAYFDRVVSYDDVTVPGEVAVYSPGIAAGRVLLVADGEASLSDAAATDIVVMADVPDQLPPAAALITGAPQTPLAHVNVLARNRGIPNLSMAQVLNDPTVEQLGRVRAWAVIEAGADNTFTIKAITQDQFRQWQSLSEVTPSAPAVAPANIEYLEPLGDLVSGELTEARMAQLRPVIGGKAAGFLALAEPGTLTLPADPVAITVRAYNEHLEDLSDDLAELLTDDRFTDDARAQVLLLEGPDEYAQVFSSSADLTFRDTIVSNAGDGDDSAWGRFVREGGVKQAIRNKAINPATLERLQADLEDNFADLSPAQGLRFRSSSSVEDIEGFNGAGLYDSNTGFLFPGRQLEASDERRTIERAMLATWSSYWNHEAYTERELEGVDHLLGAMAVLVHPRFDDAQEISNGVFTLTVTPGDTLGYTMELNVQLGAESVTNPTPGSGATPEVIEVSAVGDGAPRVERMAESSLAEPGAAVLSDEDATELFTRAVEVTRSWLDRVNAAKGAAQQRQAVILDFEFRQMHRSWPAQSNGAEAATDRLVIKQVRSLDPGPPTIADDLNGQSTSTVPADILARASRVWVRECSGEAGEATGLLVTTDDRLLPVMGYADSPFVAQVDLALEGVQRTIAWPDMTASVNNTTVAVVPTASGAADGFGEFSLDADGRYRFSGGQLVAGGRLGCTEQTLFASPAAFLEGLLTNQ